MDSQKQARQMWKKAQNEFKKQYEASLILRKNTNHLAKEAFTFFEAQKEVILNSILEEKENAKGSFLSPKIQILGLAVPSKAQNQKLQGYIAKIIRALEWRCFAQDSANSVEFLALRYSSIIQYLEQELELLLENKKKSDFIIEDFWKDYWSHIHALLLRLIEDRRKFKEQPPNPTTDFDWFLRHFYIEPILEEYLRPFKVKDSQEKEKLQLFIRALEELNSHSQNNNAELKNLCKIAVSEILAEFLAKVEETTRTMILEDLRACLLQNQPFQKDSFYVERFLLFAEGRIAKLVPFLELTQKELQTSYYHTPLFRAPVFDLKKNKFYIEVSLNHQSVVSTIFLPPYEMALLLTYIFVSLFFKEKKEIVYQDFFTLDSSVYSIFQQIYRYVKQDKEDFNSANPIIEVKNLKPKISKINKRIYEALQNSRVANYYFDYFFQIKTGRNKNRQKFHFFSFPSQSVKIDSQFLVYMRSFVR
jgi:hypothetical protein